MQRNCFKFNVVWVPYLKYWVICFAKVSGRPGVVSPHRFEGVIGCPCRYATRYELGVLARSGPQSALESCQEAILVVFVWFIFLTPSAMPLCVQCEAVRAWRGRAFRSSKYAAELNMTFPEGADQTMHEKHVDSILEVFLP